ncbi:MoaD/ThiS family protein [Polaribacter vadi]|uniref:MoaD/ThiS family protein n=1 Tax=Polaribacter vadi TaxID=1774273 RepID=UPI0030EB2C96|tara:strand:- start:5576 stop:5818 length:243 start_codon:yes stop_codon:yes gene_type:complete
MNIKTLFFGITADLVQNSELQISVDENSSVANFKLILKNKFPQLENLNSYAIAVNEEYAEDDLTLKNGDIVAVIPPVSGG